ncbi:MAG: hypothetical protein A2W28_08425 [Gammaproteobacteria bacterium RBG_16_51_14]|nr:MAG: hypothetical protein A2W28_08425 [Gammaproteobacteria bacterium RBG_16_51_14]
MKKVLIIKQGALGDIVMTTPLLKPIRNHHADDELWILTTPLYADIFSRWPGIHVKGLPRAGIYNYLQTVFWIRKTRFDRIYDLQSSDRTALLCLLSNARERIGNHPRYPYNIHPVDRFRGQYHIFRRMQIIIASAGITCSDGKPSLPVNPDEQERVVSWLNRHGLLDKSFAVLHAGASPRHPEKRWPFYKQIGKLLEDRGIRPVWAGARDDAALNVALAEAAGINATSIFTLPELAELGRHARFAITNDSGPMHVLSCSNIPVYALFGPTNWRRNHAIGQAHNVISLQPDDIEGKAITDPAISRLENIPVQRVVDRLEQDGML